MPTERKQEEPTAKEEAHSHIKCPQSGMPTVKSAHSQKVQARKLRTMRKKKKKKKRKSERKMTINSPERA